MKQQQKNFFHLHLVSDSTGMTLELLAKATVAQFPKASAIRHEHLNVRNAAQLSRALTEIEDNPGFVLYTLINEELCLKLEHHCESLKIPAIPVLLPIVKSLAGFLGTNWHPRVGAQHQFDEDYFKRMHAIDFALHHDDGQNSDSITQADVIIVGVSRTSKTPTCVYLANRGYLAANIPIIDFFSLPPVMNKLTNSLVVCLIAQVERMVQVRQSRVLSESRQEMIDEKYSDRTQLRQEMLHSRQLAAKYGWPVIDVTRKSVEETATAIMLMVEKNKATHELGE